MSQLWVRMNMIENERKALHNVKNDPELYLFIREISGEKVDWDELSSRKRSVPEETFPGIDLDDWIEDEHERSKRLKRDIFVDRTMNGRMNHPREIRKRSIMDL